MGDWYEVNSDLAIGRGQPGEEELSEIAAEGFRAIVDLRQSGEGGEALTPEAEAETVRRLGMDYAHLPTPTDRLDDQMLDRFSETIAQLPKPVFVHCASGKRSGTFALSHAAIADGLSGEVMLQRAEEAGAAYGSDAMRDIIRRYVDRHVVRPTREPAQEAPAREEPRAAGPAPGSAKSRVAEESAGALPPTAHRVEQNTDAAINRRIEEAIRASVRHHAAHPDEIDRRLTALDREWDMERMLETNAAVLALSGTLLGAFVDRRFLVLPAVVTGFLLQHAIQGWCPPVPFFRKRGVRTAAEIERERMALKALRGDFRLAEITTGDAQSRAGAALAGAEM